MLNSFRRRALPALVAVLVISTGSCARYAREPRFGSLHRDERPFAFRHNIDLIEVSNGMRVALIHDTRTNLVTVDMRYDVGAAEDPPGKAGLAHLVEHLLFELRAGPGEPTLGDELGELALHNNAYTTWDETHYTATAPVDQLAAVLALEARRMRASCEQLDEATFLRERDVVLAETAQRGMTGTTDVGVALLTAVYRAGHPYTRQVSSNEVATATRADACAFIGQYYAPNRAYLVITGPYDRSTTQQLVGKTFGPMARKARPRMNIAPAELRGTRSDHLAPIDRPTVLIYFRQPAWGDDDAVHYRGATRLLRGVLSAVDEAKPGVTNTAVFTEGGPRAPALVLALELTDLDQVDTAVDEVFRRIPELSRQLGPRAFAKMLGSMELGYVAGWDDLESRGGWIADFMQYTDHNWFMLQEMRAVASINWAQALGDLATVLTREHSHIAVVAPSGAASSGEVARAVPAGSHDLVPWRAPVDPAAADQALEIETKPFAQQVERYQLANGLVVELVPDPRSPMVDARLVFPVGRAHEPADRPNVASAAAWLLDYDIEGLYQQEMIDKITWATSRGTELDTDVSEATTTFIARGVAQWADWHVWYLSWLLDQGRYNQVHLDSMHAAARTLAKADPDEVDGDAVALRAALFGKDHPYATPPPDDGAAYLRLGAKDLERWKREHYRARGATLIVSGDFDPGQMRREIEELFGPWSGAAPATLAPVPAIRAAAGPTWLAAPDDDAAQATVTIGFATTSDEIADGAARLVLREMLQDEVRIVREGLGASYGVNASYLGGVAGTALMISGKIDEARAGAVAKLMLEAVARLRAGAAAQRESFVRARRKVLASVMARTGGASSVAGELEWLAGRSLPLDHAGKLARRIATLTPAQVGEVAAADLALARMVVQIGGKPAVVDAAFTALGVTATRPE